MRDCTAGGLLDDCKQEITLQEQHLGELAADYLGQMKAQLDGAAAIQLVPKFVLFKMEGGLDPFNAVRCISMSAICGYL